jgi:hypothetical protein
MAQFPIKLQLLINMSRLISRLRPRRAMLYCPDLKKIQKAVGLNVDSICMDLEGLLKF